VNYGRTNAAQRQDGVTKHYGKQSENEKYAFLKETVGNIELECMPIPNVMAALPNIGGALCSTPQSVANAQYSSAVHGVYKAAKTRNPLKFAGVPQTTG